MQLCLGQSDLTVNVKCRNTFADVLKFLFVAASTFLPGKEKLECVVGNERPLICSSVLFNPLVLVFETA